MTISTNIFNYATSELSQDAFLCWVFAHLTDKDNNEVNAYARFLLKKAGFPENIYNNKFEDLDIEQQVNCKKSGKADIVISWKDGKGRNCLIIEDKVNSGENRPNQLQGYMNEYEKSFKEKYNTIYGLYAKTGYVCKDEKTHIDDIKKNNKIYTLMYEDFLDFRVTKNNTILQSWLDFRNSQKQKNDDVINDIKNTELKASDIHKYFKNDVPCVCIFDSIINRLNYPDDTISNSDTKIHGFHSSQGGSPQFELGSYGNCVPLYDNGEYNFGVFGGIYLIIGKNARLFIKTHFGASKISERRISYKTKKQINTYHASDIEKIYEKWQEFNSKIINKIKGLNKYTFKPRKNLDQNKGSSRSKLEIVSCDISNMTLASTEFRELLKELGDIIKEAHQSIR